MGCFPHELESLKPGLTENTMEFLDVPLFDDDVYKMLVRFLINLLFLAPVVFLALESTAVTRGFRFTAVLMNVTVFFICFTLKKLELDIGMALGLFAVFGVLRYRADTMSTRDMTMLFVVIGLAVINSLSNHKTSYTEIAVVNSMIVIACMLGTFLGPQESHPESPPKNKSTAPSGPIVGRKQAKPAGKKTKSAARSVRVAYDRLDMLNPQRNEELLADLSARTHLPVSSVRIRDIDLAAGLARLELEIEYKSEISQSE